MSKKGFNTRAVGSGELKDKKYGNVVTPIFQNATFLYPNYTEGSSKDPNTGDSFIYSRWGNGEKRELEIFEENEYLKDVYNIYTEAIKREIFFNQGRIIGGNGSKEEMLNEAIKQILQIFHIQ